MTKEYEMTKNENKEYTISTGNVFQDLDFEKPQEELAKIKLASIINDIIDEGKLTQQKAGAILGVNQPKISALKNGRLKGFSIERLFSFLAKLDQHIEIRITSQSKIESTAGIEIEHVH